MIKLRKTHDKIITTLFFFFSVGGIVSSSRKSDFISVDISSPGISSLFTIGFFIFLMGFSFLASSLFSISGYSKEYFSTSGLSKHFTKSSCISITESYLFLGFLAAAFITIFSTLCGIVGFCFLRLGIGSFKCFRAISTALSPLNGIVPVNNSYISIPNE